MIRAFISIGILLLCGASHASPLTPADFTAAETELRTVAQEADSLSAVRRNMIQQADDLAGRIAELRRKDDLSQAEHEELQEMLRMSQHLQERMRDVDSRIEAVAARQRESIDDLIRSVQREIDRTLQRIESADATETSTLTDRLQVLLGKQEAWQARRVPHDPGAMIAYPVEADPADSPRRLRVKGDILADQVDLIHRRVDAVEVRIESLRDEMRIRQKVQELAGEMELFDEWEEMLGRSPVTAADGARDFTTGPTDNPDLTNVMPPALNIGISSMPEILQALNDPAPRSPDAIQDWIERLAAHRDRMRSRADSLGERSQWFYHQAEEKSE